MNRPPRGVTLIELLVVLVLLGALLSVSGLALAALRPPTSSRWRQALLAARAQAIRTGQAVTVRTDSTAVRFFPDGRALGPGVDPLTGWPDAPR
jgi:prepilin-type N-terminal cleavage/methylation domain-containing protein